MNEVSIANPFSNSFHACHDFSKICCSSTIKTTLLKIAIVATSVFAGLVSLGIGGVVVFRLLVDRLIQRTTSEANRNLNLTLEKTENLKIYQNSKKDFVEYLRGFQLEGDRRTRHLPILRSLYLTKSLLSKIDSKDMQELKGYFTNINQLYTEYDKPYLGDLSYFPNLTTLTANNAEVINASDCTSLMTLTANKAEIFYLCGCTSLTTLTANKIKSFSILGFPALATLTIKNAEEVFISNCPALITIITKKAKKISISNCPALTTVIANKAREMIVLNCTALARIDSSNYHNLKHLELYEVSQLPQGLGTLTNLVKLDLSDNTDLSGLPNEIFDLPSSCIVDITNCGFSIGVLERISEKTDAEDYQGPQIGYSVTETSDDENERSSEEILISLYQKADIEYKKLENIPGNEIKEQYFNSWLNRLCYIADLNFFGKRSKSLAQNIVKFLKLADLNTEFRKICGVIIEEGSHTCGDRVVLSLLQMGIQYRFTSEEILNLTDLAEFLVKGFWVIQLLEKLAQYKVKELPLFDAVEIYLGYPIRLKERLDLPIVIDQMSYFDSDRLTDDDIKWAEKAVRNEIENPTKKIAFLIQQEKWIQALKTQYPDQIKALKVIKDEKLKSAKEDKDYRQLEKDYNKGLKKLTKKTLQL